MKPRILTREEVAQKLRDWADGRASTEEIQSWATSAYMHDEVDFSDWEGEDDSVAKEVVAALDMLDMNLVLPEDAPIYLDFLATPVGDFAAGYDKFRARVDAIDYQTRSARLRDVVPYAPFLKPGRKKSES